MAKEKKKRAEKYEPKIKFNGEFIDLLRAVVGVNKDKQKDNKKTRTK